MTKEKQKEKKKKKMERERKERNTTLHKDLADVRSEISLS